MSPRSPRRARRPAARRRRAPASRRGRPRHRIAPRRAPRGRRRSRIDWDRLGRISLVLVLFVILVLYVNPLADFFDSWSESRAEREHLDQVRAENADLRRRVAVLDQPDATEREARRIGMVTEGERSYVIRNLPR